jgi:spore germination protein KC
MKPTFLLTMFITSLAILTGCWDRVELNDVAIVTGIAVEKGKEYKYKMTVEVLNAAENSKMQAQGNTPSITYSQEGNSISELAHRMNVGLSRELVYSHTRVFIIGKDIAKEGLMGFLDYLERSGEFRNDFNILLYEEGNASDALKITYPLQKVSSLKLNKQIETLYRDWGGDPNIRLTDFISALTSEGKEPSIASIHVKGDLNKGKSVENIQKTDLDAIVEVTGLAIFKDDKLVGMLSPIDTRSLLWLKDIHSTSLTVPCESEGNNFIDLRILESRASIQSKMKSGTPHFTVQINAEGRLDGTQCSQNLEKIKTYESIEKNAEKLVEKEISDTIKKVQKKYESDIFGFGEVLNRQHYNNFQKIKSDWNEHFSESTFDVNVSVFLRRSGIRNKSFETEQDQNRSQ